MKNSFKWGLVAVVVLAVLSATVYFGKPSTQKGSFPAPQPQPNSQTPPPNSAAPQPVAAPRPMAQTCGSTWTKVFDGQVSSANPDFANRLWQMTVTKNATYANFRDYIQDGCSFKITRTWTGVGLTQDGGTSFECTKSSLYAGINQFSCVLANTSGTGNQRDEEYDGINVRFVPDGLGRQNTAFYQPLNNQADPLLNERITIFAKK